VVGGETTGVNEYPWMALIIKRFSPSSHTICGGALINPRWVVSGLHCVVRTMNVTSLEDLELMPLEAFDVVLGDHNPSIYWETDITRGFWVDEVVMHPGGQDIALLKLEADADPGLYTPICLPPAGKDFRERNAVVTGWGFDEATDGNNPYASMPDALQELELPILSRTLCDTFMSLSPIALGEARETLMCFGGGSTGACFGDSGGPLVVEEDGRWVLAGTVSGAIGLTTSCATFGTYALAVEVSAESVLNFLTSTIAEDNTS